jgi:hypothetical protein
VSIPEGGCRTVTGEAIIGLMQPRVSCYCWLLGNGRRHQQPQDRCDSAIARTDIFPSVNEPGAVASCSTSWLQAPYRSQWHWNVAAPSASPSPVPATDRPSPWPGTAFRSSAHRPELAVALLARISTPP